MVVRLFRIFAHYSRTLWKSHHLELLECQDKRKDNYLDVAFMKLKYLTGVSRNDWNCYPVESQCHVYCVNEAIIPFFMPITCSFTVKSLQLRLPTPSSVNLSTLVFFLTFYFIWSFGLS